MPDAITFQHYEVLVRGDGTPWELGRGAMGVTYKALDTNLRVPVALKVIHPRQLDSELVAQRFVREARAAARLRHPHIAAVYHLGQEGENWFYAMEFVAGDTAEGLVKCEGPLPESIVLTLAVQAARALHAADALGLVHRDIKPSNLMLTRDGDEWQLKVIDFGLARTFTGSEADVDLAAVTHSGFVGTPYYASPEQLEQKELDIRSDIYSLGVTLWFLLTGKVPFTGSVVSVLSQHLHKAPPFEQLAGCTSPALRGLIERMLAKEPAARPQSALDLRRELERCNCPPQAAAAITAAPAPVLPPPPSPSEEALETIAAPQVGDTAPVFTPGASQFDAAETVAEFGFGQLCRARECTSGEPFAILRIGPLRGLEESAVAALRQTIERARQIEHPQVWRVHALEANAGESRIVMAWSDGYSWRDLLRRHRELEPDAAFRLLELAAGGIDAILAAGLGQPDVSLAGLWCEAPTPDALPVGVKVSPLGILRIFSLDATWIGEGTIAGAGATGPESGAKGAIRGLAQVAYETLGGAVTAPGFPPLPALSEPANKVLRAALRDPEQFATASALIEELNRAQSEPAPIASLRAPAAVTRQTATHAPEAAVRETVAPPSQPPPASEPDLSKAAAASNLPAAPPAEEAIAREAFAAEFPPASRSRSGGLRIAAALAIVAAVAWLIFRPDDRWRDHSEAEPIAKLPATPKPEPVSATPAPVAVVKPPPATPVPLPPPPPAPTRAELASAMQRQAADFREQGKWKDSASVLLKMRESFPELAAASVDLELLFRQIRWRFTPHRDQSAELKHADVEALRPEMEQAEKVEIIGARMLLGEYLSTETDWRRAVEYYEKARDRAPKATTRIGLLYARFSNDPADLEKAWRYLQTAHQAGDLDGKIAVAESFLYGNFGGGKFVPGLKADEQKGAKLLREIIELSPSRQIPLELADANLVETYLTEPNRSKLALGTFYLNWELKPEDQQEWYRQEKATLDHGKELRRLLDEAKEDWSDAYRLLGVAAQEGIGEKPNPTVAAAYFKQGVARNNPAAMFNYAVLLTNSAPSKTASAEARRLYLTAAEKGHPGAMEFCEKNKIPFTRKPVR